MRDIDQLVALQAIDTHLDADRKRYAAIQAALHPPASLQQAKETRAEIAARIEQWRGERRKYEREVADQTARIQAQEKQLYSGKVKDPREQVALQQNVESLKRHLETLEEAELEAILEQEQAESDLDEAEKKLAEEQEAWAETEANLIDERQTLISHAKHLKNERNAAAAGLDPALLKRYESLRQKHGGVAVAALQGSSCGGCGAALPTGLRQQIYGSEIITCPVCGRILYGR